MTSTLRQGGRIELLLTKLRCERHVQRTLLWELIDELDETAPPPKTAAEAARGLLVLLEAGISGDDFSSELDRIVNLARVEPASNE